jgi:hypothetical protein
MGTAIAKSGNSPNAETKEIKKPPSSFRGRSAVRTLQVDRYRNSEPSKHHTKTFQSAGTSFTDLLERAGFYIRGKRADCPQCESEGHGRGRSTVAFTDEVAFCHRCKWTANVRTLARTLGLTVAPEMREQRTRREQAAEFRAWLDTCDAILVRRLRSLTIRAELAKLDLTICPEHEPAWDALADFYHNRASILAALDTLACEKLSPWIEQPMTRERLAEGFADAENTWLRIETTRVRGGCR